MQFNRGDRVRRIGTPGTIERNGALWNGQTGTITRLPGDPGYSPEPGFAWVKWDHPAIADQWVDIEELKRIA